MPSGTRIQTAKADFLESSLYDDTGLVGLPRLSRGTFLTTLSRGFDLAEGRRPGHAQRVAYIGVALAREFGLEASQIEDVFFACLLHDVGMVSSNPGPRVETRRGTQIVSGDTCAADILASMPTGGWAAVIEALTKHCEMGASVARNLGMGESTARAISSHHDCWDASAAVTGDELLTPLVARVTATADRVESMIDADGSPLLVRRHGPQLVREMAGSEVDPQTAEKMADLARSDDFWLGLYDNDMAGMLSESNFGGMMMPAELFEFAAVVADLIDARNGRQVGRSRRVSKMARRLTLGCDMNEQRADLVKLAALLQDMGTMGIPPHFLSKPDILTIEEMDVIQLHPTYARDILSEVPGLGAVSWWIGCHHERIDGKGYPGMLEGDEVPVEAQIIGVVDTYDALINERPYRHAIPPAEAFEVLSGLSGTRFSPWVLDRFESMVGPFH